MQIQTTPYSILYCKLYCFCAMFNIWFKHRHLCIRQNNRTDQDMVDLALSIAVYKTSCKVTRNSSRSTVSSKEFFVNIADLMT